MFIEKPANKNSLKNRSLLFGVGVNDAHYLVTSKSKQKRVTCPFYRKWVDMLKRCYDPKYLNKNISYRDCYVCDDWLFFSTFKSWMESQDWQGKQLDKDLLISKNKIYSPLSCMFVSREVNSLITRPSCTFNLPIGVSYCIKRSKFMATCRYKGKSKYIGVYDNKNKAFQAYKEFKYKIIKELALKQNEMVKNALLNFIIEE